MEWKCDDNGRAHNTTAHMSSL